MSQLTDTLLELCRRLSLTGYAFLDMQANEYGWSVVVYDQEPRDMEDLDGNPVTLKPGSIITAGRGANLTEAIERAQHALGQES